MSTTRSRHRSSSDPFSDPLALRANIHRPPDPPPKQYIRMPAPPRPRDNVADAIRDTVTVTPRKPTRSQTS